MPVTRSPFPIRMIYATSKELIDYGKVFRANWAVVASTGHKTAKRSLEDPPVYMPEYGKLAPYRRRLRARIEARRKQIRDLIRYAHRAGMKAIYHAYELSVPEGFQQAYPRLFCKAGTRYATVPPQEVADQREMCVARPQVREALAAKVAETICALPGLDGYMYSNNESSTLTKVWHRCDYCKDIPFSRMMKHLNDALAEGIRRSGRPVRLFNRCWGTHETKQRYWRTFEQRADFGVAELEDKAWLPEYVEARRPKKLSFNPKRDIPRYVRLLGDDDTIFVYKATWADVNLHHPLNPWHGKYAGHDEVVEVSFEHCGRGPQGFYVMGREMQRRARLARRKRCQGLCCVPVAWGAQDTNPVSTHPSKWSLNEANIHLFAAVVKNPDADVARAARDYLRRRYGGTVPAELAAMLLDSEDIAADAMNLSGIRATGGGLGDFYSDLLRYSWMFPDWQQRVRRTPANLRRISAAKDRNVRRAEKMLQRIEQLKGKLPGKAYREFRDRFGDLLATARRFQARHKHAMMLWALKDGKIKPTLANIEALCRYGQAGARPRRTRPARLGAAY